MQPTWRRGFRRTAVAGSCSYWAFAFGLSAARAYLHGRAYDAWGSPGHFSADAAASSLGESLTYALFAYGAIAAAWAIVSWVIRGFVAPAA